MTTVEQSQFENLHFYTAMTRSLADDKAFAGLVDTIMDTVPKGVTKDDVMAAINQAIADTPGADMDEILEAAVDRLNQDHGGIMDGAAAAALHDAWDTYKDASGLADDDIGAILADPVSVTLDQVEKSSTSIKQILAMLYLLMIELAGEESANQLLEGCAQRDQIKELAKEKASKIRTKAWIEFGTQMATATINVTSGMVSFGAGGLGLGAALKGNQGASQSLGALGTSFGTFSSGISGGATAVSGVITGHIDARIAEIDGESQVAQGHMDIANKMKQRAIELFQGLLSMLQSISQADHTTMTAIGRI